MAIEALYIHVPYCASKCFYCDFDSRACNRTSEKLDTYVEDTISRIRSFGDAGFLSSVTTVFFGGGTPSFLSLRLPRIVEEILHYCSPEEVSFEANPDSLSPELIAAMKRAGATRVSIGVQSFVDSELKAVGRVHTAEQARKAIAQAKATGMFVSCDLMCGLPYQTLESWTSSVKAALASGVDHVSVYPLMVMEGTPLSAMVEKNPKLDPDEDLQADMMDVAYDLFVQHGFNQYEVASYAKPGCACKHNIAYWTGVEYLGLGRSASSMVSQITYSQLVDAHLLPSLFEGNEYDVCFHEGSEAEAGDSSAIFRVRFTQKVDLTALETLYADQFTVETLNAREAAAEDLMLGCRLHAGLPYATVARALSAIGEHDVCDAVEQAIELDLLYTESDSLFDVVKTDGASRQEKSKCHVDINVQFEPDKFVNYVGYTDCGLKPTHKGWLLGNELFELFWNLAE